MVPRVLTVLVPSVLRVPVPTVLTVLVLAGCGVRDQSRLAIGSPAPVFSLPGTDGKVHKIDVRITRPGLVARGRRSYQAPKG